MPSLCHQTHEFLRIAAPARIGGLIGFSKTHFVFALFGEVHKKLLRMRSMTFAHIASAAGTLPQVFYEPTASRDNVADSGNRIVCFDSICRLVTVSAYGLPVQSF